MGAVEVGGPDDPGAGGAPWPEDAAVDLGVSLGLRSSRIRLATRYGLSRRSPEALLAGSAGAADLPGAADAEFAHAILGRLEVELWQGDALRVLGFGSYRRADPFFPDLQQLRGLERFGGSDRSALQSGVRLGARPLSLELAREWRERGLSRHGDVGSSRTDKIRAELAADLDPVRRSIGAARSIAWLTPRSVWLRMGSGRTWKRNLGSGHSDPIADLSGGITWSGGSYQATLGLWRSVSGAHAPFGDVAQWSASGAQLDGRLSTDVWTFSGLAGFRHDASSSDEVGQIPESFYGSLSLGLEAFPRSRLSATLGFGHDAAEEALLEASRRFRFDAVVDLAQSRSQARARLRAVYDLGFRGIPDDLESQSHALRAALEIDF